MQAGGHLNIVTLSTGIETHMHKREKKGVLGMRLRKNASAKAALLLPMGPQRLIILPVLPEKLETVSSKSCFLSLQGSRPAPPIPHFSSHHGLCFQPFIIYPSKSSNVVMDTEQGP